MLLCLGEGLLMKPLLTLCSTCKYYVENENKAECYNEKFVLTISEGKIAVPLDYECFDFEERKEN